MAQTLYGSAERTVGQKIKIGENTYKVAGVFKVRNEDYIYSGGEDDFVWLP